MHARTRIGVGLGLSLRKASTVMEEYFVDGYVMW